MGSRYADRPLCYVLWEGFSVIYRTNATTAVKTDLGIEDVNFASALTKPIFGATYPTPPVLSKRGATGWDSSYVASAKLVSARSSGWQLIEAAHYGNIIESSASGTLASSKYVTTSGIAYAWNQAKDIAAKLVALAGALNTGFGIEDCDLAQIETYVWGATLPHPAHAFVVNNDSSPTGAGDTHLVKVDDAKINSLPTGFRITKPKFDWTAFGGAPTP